MHNKNPILGGTVVAICAAAISGCGSVTQVKDVTSDTAAYQAKKFSAESLTPGVAKKIPVRTTAAAQKPISFEMEANYESADGKKETWRNTITLTSLGNGLVQRKSELSNNDIPYRINFSLTYLGIMDLRWQGVPLRGTVTEPLYEVKDVKRFDSLPTTENQEFVVEYSTGNDVQLANFMSAKKVCKGTRRVELREIHKKLSGVGLEFECQQFTNDVMQGRSKWVFLQDYDVYIQTESTGSAYKTIVRVLDVTI